VFKNINNNFLTTFIREPRVLATSIFQHFDTKIKFELQVAHTGTGSFMTLPDDMWSMLATPRTRHTEILTNLYVGFPKTLKPKYQEQLAKVYSKCIFPAQYLPQLFTDNNKKYLLRSSLHIAEVPGNIAEYTQFTETSIPQMCRFAGIILFSFST